MSDFFGRFFRFFRCSLVVSEPGVFVPRARNLIARQLTRRGLVVFALLAPHQVLASFCAGWDSYTTYCAETPIGACKAYYDNMWGGCPGCGFSILPTGGVGNFGDDTPVNRQACQMSSNNERDVYPLYGDIWKDLGCDKSAVGNPCNPKTGNKYHVEVDHASPNSELVYTRTYNSLFGHDVGLGYGWIAASKKYLSISQSGTYIAMLGATGRGESFSKNSTSGVWQGDGDTTLRLTQDASGYTAVHKDGVSERYNLSGKLLTETDRSGNVTVYAYDASGRLVSVTAPFGHTLTFGYNATGRVSSVTDADGKVVSYSYDVNSNLARVDYPDGTAKIYHYENTTYPNHLTGISDIDQLGLSARYSAYSYDTNGKAVLTQHVTADGSPLEKFTLSYDSASQTTVTDATGNREVLSFATNLGVKNLISRTNLADNKVLNQTFDANNNLTCQQDEEGRVTTYTYSPTNQKLTQTEGQGGSCAAPVATSATRTTSYQYLSPELDLPTVIEAPSVAGGSNRKRTEISYDPTLKVPRTITQRGYTPGGSAVARSVTLGYNSRGQVTSIDGPRTDVNDLTTLAYNECTTGGGCGQLRSVTNALGQVTNYNAYDAAGRLIEMTDPNGLKTFYGYDLRGRVLSFTLKAPDASTRMTAYAYDAAGNVTEIRTPDGRVLTQTYDAANYLRSVTDNLGNKVEYRYDLKGNRTATQTFDPQGTLVRSLELAYDARNRVSEINQGGGASGSITRQRWDAVGNLTQVTDPNTVAANGSAATVHDYDPLNRLLKTTDRLSGLTQYDYAANDRIKQVVSPNSATTGYVVDDLGNVLTETSPDRGTVTYTYDSAGNITQLTDARAITVAYSNDALGRLSSATFPDAAENITYGYDTCANGKGRLCTVTDGAGSVVYAYDGFGALAEETRTELGVSYTTRYGYDPLNRVASIAYPDGRVVAYTRNSLGQVTDVTLTQAGTTQPLASNLQYRADGLLSGLTYGNGLRESRLYSLAGRLETWTVGSETRGFLYDANGNLKDQTGAVLAGFRYDALDRLQSESLQSLSQTFGYDANGNRQSDGTGSYGYLAQSNRITMTPDGSVTLDAAGNLVTQGSRSFSYYGSGQLRDVTDAGVVVASYAYNHQRQRTRKTVGNETTVYHHDLHGRLLQETDPAGTVFATYVYVDDHPLAVWIVPRLPTDLRPLPGRRGQGEARGVEAVITHRPPMPGPAKRPGLSNPTPLAPASGEAQMVYLHTDHLDTPRLATNAQGRVVWRWAGEAFGATAPNEDSDGDGTTTTVNLRFAGQYYDAETGLHYNWNRYYDPRIGRYITSDPIGLRGGLNTYLYARANPLRYVDPRGLSSATYDPSTGTVTVVDSNGNPIGSYPAGNNTTNPAGDPNTVGSNGPAPSGTFPVQPPVNTEGRPEYGPYFWPIGDVGPNGERRDIARQRGIGLHCGRRGPQSPTQGCIRMSDQSCRDLYDATRGDPLTEITIGQ